MNEFITDFVDFFYVSDEEKQRKRYEKIVEQLRGYKEELIEAYPRELANEVSNAKALLSGEYSLSGPPYVLFMEYLADWVKQYERIIDEYDDAMSNVDANLEIALSKAAEWRRLEDIEEGRK